MDTTGVSCPLFVYFVESFHAILLDNIAFRLGGDKLLVNLFLSPGMNNLVGFTSARSMVSMVSNICCWSQY